MAAAERAEARFRQLQAEAEKAVQQSAQDQLLAAEKHRAQLQKKYSQ